MFKRQRKSAMVTTEVAIGIGMAVLVLFVTIGLFSDNLATMVENSGLLNIFNQNPAKTEYESYSRDYASSQINVQIMGAQGLSMLRRKANNKAIEIIEESFNNSNPNANSIAYLAGVIKIITGEYSICPYMNKDSDRHCDELDGYKYSIDLSGNALLVKNAKTDENIQLNIPDVITVINDIISQININSDGYPDLTTEQKYQYIKDLTDKLLSYLRSDVVLINDKQTFISTQQEVIVLKLEKESFNKFTTNLKNSVLNAKEECEGHRPPKRCGHHHVEAYDYKNLKDWANDLYAKLATAESTIEITNITNELLKSNLYLRAIEDDSYNRPNSCTIFTNELNKINKKYQANIKIPQCIPTNDQ